MVQEMTRSFMAMRPLMNTRAKPTCHLLQVIVPLGNYQVIDEAISNPSQSTSDLTTLINESKNHPANVAWGVTNEITNDGSCGSPISQQCLNLIVKACQLIQQLDPSSRPVLINHVDEPGFTTPKAVKSALQNAGMSSFYNNRIIQGLDLYFFGQVRLLQASSSLLPDNSFWPQAMLYLI